LFLLLYNAVPVTRAHPFIIAIYLSHVKNCFAGRIIIMSLLVQLLTMVNPVRVLILSILTYLLCPWLLKLINEFRISKKFSKLPRLPIIGPAGWLLGNVDIYYYTMRHLSVAQGASKWLFF